MLWQILLSALVSLVLLVVVIGLVLKRSPLLLVADKLPGNLYGGADDVSDFVDGELEEGAVDAGDGSAGGPDDGSGRDGGAT